ncbi:uncharacterized protein LOC131247341 [Magnolia sinica]|uniref:uncharacterized protein LOC131247341 n=1 Tax=Magnolia sinica TaxID=86752 RepID=UPI00265B5B71|nr:uncharacterized protein LOC131247341 [Magnolia sinica]
MSVEMASTKIYYQRLRNVGEFEGEEEEDKGLNRTRSWRRLKRASSRKRPRLRIPGLRRLLRRKARLVSATWTKMWKRLKESRNHIGELFGGNYMFMQVTPSPLVCLDKSFMGHHHYHGVPSRLPLGRLV